MTELQPLRRGAKMITARKNDRNLPITLPNFNIFRFSIFDFFFLKFFI